ncbi:homeobox protein ARX [Eucalyptus grandis]|uniref:homeobox protein ARX n=1 Tax=Eucalyptus grandis TaxID=71139 RepID=UPI00192E8E13|nr:homeobox protein ARX [Eucalyptus grandis]
MGLERHVRRADPAQVGFTWLPRTIVASDPPRRQSANLQGTTPALALHLTLFSSSKFEKYLNLQRKNLFAIYAPNLAVIHDLKPPPSSESIPTFLSLAKNPWILGPLFPVIRRSSAQNFPLRSSSTSSSTEHHHRRRREEFGAGAGAGARVGTGEGRGRCGARGREGGRGNGEAVRAVRSAGDNALRVGPGEPVLGLRREGARRQLPGGEARPGPPLPRVPVPDPVEGLGAEARPHGLGVRVLPPDLRRKAGPGAPGGGEEEAEDYDDNDVNEVLVDDDYGDEDEDEEEEEEEEIDDEEEEEDGENQVVPWSCDSPPPAASSSTEGESTSRSIAVAGDGLFAETIARGGLRMKRQRQSEDLDSDDEVGCVSSGLNSGTLDHEEAASSSALLTRPTKQRRAAVETNPIATSGGRAGAESLMNALKRLQRSAATEANAAAAVSSICRLSGYRRSP